MDMYIKHTLDYFCYNFKQCIQEQETDYTYMKSKSKNITTSTNASRDLLTTQATTTITSTNLFTTSMPMLLSAIIC